MRTLQRVEQKGGDVPRTRRTPAGDGPWLSPAQHRAWLAYMRVQLRMSYEINRQLQRDSGVSLADYHVMNALSMAPDHTMQVTDLAATIGWERSRVPSELVAPLTAALEHIQPSLNLTSSLPPAPL